MATTKILTVDTGVPPALATNLAYLQPTGFKIVMDRRNYPNLEYFAQSIVHPGVSVPVADAPYRNVGSTAFAGDKLQFTELMCTMVMDEDMKGYEEILKWLERLVEVPARDTQTILQNSLETHYADITLSVLSSQNNPIRNIRYINCVPTDVGEVMFESTVGDIQYITYNVSFRFDYFTLV